MKTATVTISGVSPYSQSAYHKTPKIGQETHSDYEHRTWRERIHADQKGFIFIPPMSFKHALVSAAKFLGHKIPGKGQKTYRKRFESGVLCFEPMVLDAKKLEVPGDWLFVPSNGQSGSGSRVEKCFCRVDDWEGSFNIQILDEVITEPVLLEHLEAAGVYVGLGRFRPERNGYYGRFQVDGVEWN